MKNLFYLVTLILFVFNSCIDDNFTDPIDNDGDGYFLVINGDFSEKEDCNDSNANINPGATEIPYNGINDDCDPLTLDDDLDQDGFNKDVDCDDNDATVYPGAEEIPYNGIDDDCDPLTLDNDLDKDGYNNDVDCDDTNADVHPGAEEIFTDDIDNNCNGVVGYIETINVICTGCMVGVGPYYFDGNRRTGRQCADFESDLAAAAAGFLPCTETIYID
jgi:hypothetical protein